MEKKSEIICIRFESEFLNKLKEKANLENRTLSNFIKTELLKTFKQNG